MKKLLALFFVFICMSAIFVGCTDKKNKEEKPIENMEPVKITSLVGKWREIAVPGFGVYPNYEIEIENNKISIYLTTNNSQRLPWVSEWYSRKLIWQGTYNDPEQPTVDYTFTSIGKPVNVIAEDRERVFCFSDGKLSFIREYTYVEEETVPDPDNKVYLTRLDSTLDNSLDIDD